MYMGVVGLPDGIYFDYQMLKCSQLSELKVGYI